VLCPYNFWIMKPEVTMHSHNNQLTKYLSVSANKRSTGTEGSFFKAIWLIGVIILCASQAFTESKTSQALSMPDVLIINASERVSPPPWALLQRHLILTINEAAPLFLNKYSYRGGTLREHGKLDDDYECFISWPLFYIIGGDDFILDKSLEAYNAITRQWTYQHSNSVHKEFVRKYDMLHLSEGYVGFQYFSLAAPDVPENIDRARRFAGFYMNEDPLAENYDSEHKIIRSPITGSDGPAFESSADYVLIYGHASLYPIVKDLEQGWNKDDARKKEIQKLYNEIVIRGDVPMNLAITGLVSHAYIATGDEKYRDWVIEYVQAWMDRTRENGDVIPDNIGLNGEIGEYRNGQWWGGFFGWSGRYSVEMIFNSLITASECATVISGNPEYMNFLRSQVDMLLEKAIMRDGDLLVPYKVGIDGWYDYHPLGPYVLSHLWKTTMDDGDWKRVERIRDGKKHGPWAYAYADSPDPPKPGAEEWRHDGTLYDWNKVMTNLRGNQQRRNEAPHLSYLAGTNPEWPEKIMLAEYEQVITNIARLKRDDYVHEWRSQTMLTQNPVFANGLAQMTMGAPFSCFNGGLLMARVRYFDVDRQRPGLPEDVAALVTKLEKNRTVLQLINLNAFENRNVLIQAGAYGEHEFTNVVQINQEGNPSGADKCVVNANCFAVNLPPSTAITLDIGTRLYANTPTYAYPWIESK